MHIDILSNCIGAARLGQDLALNGRKLYSRVGLGMLCLFLGALLIHRVSSQGSTEPLPPGIEASLVPIAPPNEVIDLGHQGQGPSVGRKQSEYEGVAIVESDIDVALNEYARLTQSTVVRSPSLPANKVNYRGQGLPLTLAKELSSTLESAGVQLVSIGEHRFAAVDAKLSLSPRTGFNSVMIGGAWVTGLLLILVGIYFSARLKRGLGEKLG